VELGPASYPIFIGEGIFSKLGEMLQLYGLGRQAVVVTDRKVAPMIRARLSGGSWPGVAVSDIIEIAPGEKSKSLATAESVLTRLLERHYDRTLTLLAVGGGVVGDLTGFVASVYKRGVNCVQVPTTLLAQVDSSIGGKTGVNHRLGKNLIGTFAQPKLVWSDLDFLKTLPQRELICGLGEVVKYGIIEDPELFALCENELDGLLEHDSGVTAEAVRRSCEIKVAIVAQDEREHGLRMLLNFGHTIGHAIEAATGYGKMSHGAAVLAGMLAESQVALEMNLLHEEAFARIRELVLRFDLGKALRGLRPDDIDAYIRADKKALSGKTRMVLPLGIGEAEVAEDVGPEQVRRGVEALLAAV